MKTVSYGKLLTGLNFVDLLPICLKFHGSTLHHVNHENLYTTKFNTLTVAIWQLHVYNCCIRVTALTECFEWTLNKPHNRTGAWL